MKSRIGKKALEFLMTGAGAVLHKYSLAELAPCDQRSAYAALKRLHKNHKIFICAWHAVPHAKIPVYSLGYYADMPKPSPLTRDEINKRRLKNKKYMLREKLRKRALRKELKIELQSSNERKSTMDI